MNEFVTEALVAQWIGTLEGRGRKFVLLFDAFVFRRTSPPKKNQAPIFFTTPHK